MWDGPTSCSIMMVYWPMHGVHMLDLNVYIRLCFNYGIHYDSTSYAYCLSSKYYDTCVIFSTPSNNYFKKTNASLNHASTHIKVLIHQLKASFSKHPIFNTPLSKVNFMKKKPMDQYMLDDCQWLLRKLMGTCHVFSFPWSTMIWWFCIVAVDIFNANINWCLVIMNFLCWL